MYLLHCAPFLQRTSYKSWWTVKHAGPFPSRFLCFLTLPQRKMFKHSEQHWHIWNWWASFQNKSLHRSYTTSKLTCWEKLKSNSFDAKDTWRFAYTKPKTLLLALTTTPRKRTKVPIISSVRLCQAELLSTWWWMLPTLEVIGHVIQKFDKFMVISSNSKPWLTHIHLRNNSTKPKRIGVIRCCPCVIIEVYNN